MAIYITAGSTAEMDKNGVLQEREDLMPCVSKVAKIAYSSAIEKQHLPHLQQHLQNFRLASFRYVRGRIPTETKGTLPALPWR